MKSRNIRLVVIVAALAVVSAACGGGESESSSTTIAQTTIPAEQRQPATLTLWSTFGDTEVVEAFQPIIDKCEADNPWLTIDYVAKDGMATAFAAAAEAGDVPDIIQADFSGGLAKLEAAGAVYPIDEFASRDNFDWDQFVPGSVKLVTFNGKKWGIPLSVDTAGLFFNQDTLDEAGLEVPTSFEELSAAAEALLVQNPDGSIERIGWVPDVGDGSFAVPTGLLFGAKLFSEDGTQVTVNTQEWIDALNWQRSFYEPFGDYENFARFVGGFGSYDSAQNFFITGQVPLYLEASYFTTWPERFGNGQPANWGVAPFPGPDGVTDAGELAIIGSGNAFYVPAKATDPEASWIAASCMATATQQIADFEVVVGNIPANKAALDIFETVEVARIPAYKTFIDLAKSSNAVVPNSAVIIETAYDQMTALALAYRRGDFSEADLPQQLADLQARLEDELALELGS
jgi:multiple sugar transport system substrate-binding protein